MPELPDVEVFRNYLNSTALHKKIENVKVLDKKILGNVSSRSLRRQLKNQQFETTQRHGKYLFAGTDDEKWLVFHFGMTGFLRYFKDSETATDHVRIQFDFTNGYHLAYDCQRKFGKVGVVKDMQNFIQDKKLGIDPYDDNFDLRKFKSLADSSRGTVKSFLMNQKIIAGIGNIYSDEILFSTGIHPDSKLNKLQESDLKDIFRALKKVLDTAIEKKVNVSDFPSHYLLPNREEGKGCPKCSGKIKKAVIAGRSSYFCSKHQKLKE